MEGFASGADGAFCFHLDFIAVALIDVCVRPDDIGVGGVVSVGGADVFARPEQAAEIVFENDRARSPVGDRTA